LCVVDASPSLFSVLKKNNIIIAMNAEAAKAKEKLLDQIKNTKESTKEMIRQSHLGPILQGEDTRRANGKRDEEDRIGYYRGQPYLRPAFQTCDSRDIAKAAYGDPSPDFIAEMTKRSDDDDK
jgi:hypothetical protein